LESLFYVLQWKQNQTVKNINSEKSPLKVNILKKELFLNSEYTIGISMFKLVRVGSIKFQKIIFFKKVNQKVQKSNYPYHTIGKLVSKTNTTNGIPISKNGGVGPIKNTPQKPSFDRIPM
jgi:hypothetical protein